MTIPDTDDRRTFLTWRIWLTYGVLTILGIPWYWPAESDTRLFGAPAWVVTALAASLAVSIFTAVLLRRDWSEPLADTNENQPPGSESS